MQFLVPPFAMSSGDLIGLVAVFLIFGGGSALVKLLENRNRTRIELAQLRSQQQGGEGLQREVHALRDELAMVREQLRDLKDTTTQYDISFDTALQRMDRRMGIIEQDNQQRLGH